MVGSPNGEEQTGQSANIRQNEASVVWPEVSEAAMTAARESAGKMFAKRESRDGDHADVLRKLEITIERPTGAIAQFAEESQALAAQRVVETIHQRGWISREQPLGHRRAVENPAGIDRCCYIFERTRSIRPRPRHRPGTSPL